MKKVESAGRFKVVVKSEGPLFVAQTLEKDFVGQGKSQGAALKSLIDMIIAHVLISEKEGRVPFKNIKRAPRKAWALAKAAKVRSLIPTKAHVPELELNLA